MRTALIAGLVAAGSVVGATSVSAAHTHAMPTHVALHVPAKFKSHAMFMHVMASAKLTYTKHDTGIKLTTDNLPKASALGGKAYVLFASDGAMTEKVGVLHASGNMAAVSNMIMMTKISHLWVYAESNPGSAHTNGQLVLSGMV